MTSTRYYLSRIARAFGINRRNQRMGDAASETHLLREAEAYLGGLVWEKIEHIDPLAPSYWNLRKLAQEKEVVSAKLAECQERLNKAHAERADLLNTISDPEQRLHAEKAEIVTKLNALASRRDEVVAAAKEIRKSYEGLKVKSEVLASEAGNTKPGEADQSKIKDSLNLLKTRFNALKTERTEISEQIEKGDARINELAEQIKELKKGHHELASKAFQVIGDANKDISALRAEYGVLDTRMTQLQAEIGRHVSRNASNDPNCAEAAKGHQGLVDVMRALRKSITLNYKLAEM